MKKAAKFMILILILTLAFPLATGIPTAFASKGSDDSSSSGSDDSATHDINDDSKSSGSSSSGSSLSTNPEYAAFYAEKERLSTQIDSIKNQLDSAEKGGDAALISRLTLQLRDLKNQKDTVEMKMQQLIGDDRFKPFDDSKHRVETELEGLKTQRDAVEKELLRLQTQLGALGTSPDASVLADLNKRISEQEALKISLQTQIQEKRIAIRDFLRKLYSDDEWNTANSLQTTLNQIPGMKALPLNSILVTGKEVKFDTPPVISSGRTLIPVRAIASSLGATVLWNEQEQKITIQKGSTVLEFEIGDDSMKLNGNSVKLEVPAQIINGRTVIPLRAMVEGLGLSIDWDGELQLLEIK